MGRFVILLVEDDVLQREVLAGILRDCAYEVIECSTAEAAELVVATSGTELLALVTDVNLEGEMTGLELAEFTRQRFPHINVILLSGRSPPLVPDGVDFFIKPFAKEALLTTIADRRNKPSQ